MSKQPKPLRVLSIDFDYFVPTTPWMEWGGRECLITVVNYDAHHDVHYNRKPEAGAKPEAENWLGTLMRVAGCTTSRRWTTRCGRGARRRPRVQTGHGKS